VAAICESFAFNLSATLERGSVARGQDIVYSAETRHGIQF